MPDPPGIAPTDLPDPAEEDPGAVGAGLLAEPRGDFPAANPSPARASGPAPDLVIWPEDAVGLDPRDYPFVYAEIAGALGAVGRPILVGGIFNTINPSVYASRENPVAAKFAYQKKDMADWARSAGLAIKMRPTVFPVNSVKAMRDRSPAGSTVPSASARTCTPHTAMCWKSFIARWKSAPMPGRRTPASSTGGVEPESE